MCVAVLRPRLSADSHRPEPRPTFPRPARADPTNESTQRPRVEPPPPPQVVDEEQDAERWDGMS